MKFLGFKTTLILLFLAVPAYVFAQVNANGSTVNAIGTAVPFLNITPDSRSGGLGDAGVAITPDANSNFWNPSKLAFIEDDNMVSVSYSPWLRNFVPDMNLSYLSFAHRVNERNSIGASMRYFNLGAIQLIDANQVDQGTYKPSEFALDFSFARKFSNDFSLGLTMRYIRSDLSNLAFSTGSSQQAKAANGLAADISAYYKNDRGYQFGVPVVFAIGANISNIGTKLSYIDNGPQYFLPTNFKIGAANTWKLDALNEITLSLDINKLLVPTPPVRDNNGDIVAGKDDNRSVPGGVFGSFTDAPGGFSEELREISYSPGVEYNYNKTLALRAGYFHESPTKGNRQYFTMGIGLKYLFYSFDFAYLAAQQRNSPLANTLRFSLAMSFGSTKQQ
ncbi:MAG: type IX secretion system outer membrane channel protein PorV [Sphingobacteriaceae bacterium]|nr:MAG: type IX secretion system outer membrane channel protein PorV [Sphingobacteriaceae bacterium]